MAASAKPVFTVQVRELVEFALRQGDLGGERDFVGPNRALAGTRGHQRLQRSRPNGYQKEVRVSHEIETADFSLRIQGRIDGLLATAEEVLLEEIKTVQGGWDHTADPLHWAQAKVYGYVHAHNNGLQQITIQLTYLDLDTGELTEFRNSFRVGELSAFFEQAAATYIEWLRAHQQWCRERDESIRSLAFPFARYRPGQRQLAVAAYRVLARGGRLFLEAPTGIGKTISVLFPAVKALGEGKLERIFYLTARTVGRTVAEKACADLRQAGLRLRTLTLTAKEKICAGIRLSAGSVGSEGRLLRDDAAPGDGRAPEAPSHAPARACDPLTCPFALGYYDRRRPAMRAALVREEITRPALEAVSREHQVCPFELSLDLSSWVDVIVCDYNYVFDPKVYLRRHFAEEAGDYAFLVDEAHNLVDRAREMFSADLETQEIQEVRRALKQAVPRCAKALTRLTSALRKLAGTTTRLSDPSTELNLFPTETPGKNGPLSPALSPSEGERERHRLVAGEARAMERVAFRGGELLSACPPLTTRDFPADLLDPLDDALKQAETWLARNQAADFRECLLELYFRLHSFRRTAELYDERYVTIIEPGRPLQGWDKFTGPRAVPARSGPHSTRSLWSSEHPGFSLRAASRDGSRSGREIDAARRSVRVRLFCLDPSFLLRQALARGKAAVFFSATLTPIDYYRALLGGGPEDPLLQLPSPFPPEHLAVLVQDRIRTHLKARAGSLPDVVRAIASLVEGRPGNYLVYLPSYQYLTAVQEQFHALHPVVPILVQRPGMSEPDREAFVAAFAVEHGETLVGFAVMGGVFGEGIDLVGDRLIGAVIVGVGLPQLCVERDLIRDYFQEQTGAGFDYAYTFPGMNRVLQAIGRVIRSETDRGVVLLIDARFSEQRYRRLFPAWWETACARNSDEIRSALAGFWRPPDRKLS